MKSEHDEKQRIIAVGLAVFLPIFTWLYTYKTDNQKFWVALTLMIMSSLTFGYPVSFIIAAGIWIYAITDVIRRDEKWYENY